MRGVESLFFSKKWANPGLFFVYFWLFQTPLQCLQQIYVKKCPSSIPGFEPTTFGT